VRLAQFMLPPLTTVQMSQSELAKLAFDALLADVRRETVAPNGTEYVLRTNLVLRKSTALAPLLSLHSGKTGAGPENSAILQDPKHRLPFSAVFPIFRDLKTKHKCYAALNEREKSASSTGSFLSA